MTFIMRFKKRFYFIAAGYFKFFANFAFLRWSPRVIAITGSVGKTTMLHLIEHQLGDQAHYSHNANSAFGIAFDLLNLRGVNGSKWRWLWLFLITPFKALYFHHKQPFYVVEIDGERPRETEFLARWLNPEVTLWVSIGLSHAVQFEHQITNGQFASLSEAITHEFATLPQFTQKMVYIDADASAMVSATAKLSSKVQKISRSQLKKYRVSLSQTIFETARTKFIFAGPQPEDLVIQLLMLEQLVNYLKLELNSDFTDLRLPAGRSSFFQGKNGLKLIDSSYNAHLISVESILNMTRSLSVRPKWLVIGDIVDQGSIEGQEHTKLAELIINTKPDQVILIGRRTKKYTLPQLTKAGLPVYSTLDPRQALKFIKKQAKNHETLIFKGSQYLEWIIEQLLLNPEDAKLLPRREPAAVKRRQRRGLI